MKNEIVIDKDRLYLLIRELKEYRDLLKKKNRNPHRVKSLKVQIVLLEHILAKDGIEFYLNNIIFCKESLEKTKFKRLF